MGYSQKDNFFILKCLNKLVGNGGDISKSQVFACKNKDIVG